MKQNNPNPVVAQGAQQFAEQRKHDEIMKKLDAVCGYQYVDYGDEYSHDGPYVCWHENTLSVEELTEIMERGRHDEIMHMISCYNNAVSEENQRQVHRPSYLSLPEEIQEMLAKRNNREEMLAYLEKQGFGAKGQNVILGRGDHLEILDYVRRHGFLPEQQKMLLERNIGSEIEEHVRHHGLSDELLNGIFHKLQSGDAKLYNQFIVLHELPVDYQRLMLNMVNTDQFLCYIQLHGLWEQVHDTLLTTRSDFEIEQYIRRHRYLSDKAERLLVEKGNSELNEVYVQCKYDLKSSDNFFKSLLIQRPLNYTTISAVLLATKDERSLCHYEPEDAALMENGTRKQVLERIAKKKLLSLENFNILFFRNDPELFEAYLDSCNYGVFFTC